VINMNKKQWVKIALLSAPIIALVVASLAGLDEVSRQGLEEVIVQLIVIVAGAIGVTGVVVNNDKDSR
jgi:hypothetical protein